MSKPGTNSQGFAVVILAAGASSKNGRPVPLRPLFGRSVLEHVTRKALASGAREVVVVAGNDVEDFRHQLRRLPVRVVQNRDWHEGIASSIRAGISSIKTKPAAAIICLCDQPKITSDHLRALGERAVQTDAPPIVASAYDGVLGAPAAFARSLFPNLLALSGDAGARHLIRSGSWQVEAICFASANDEVEVEIPASGPKWSREITVFSGRWNRIHAARAPPSMVSTLVAV